MARRWTILLLYGFRGTLTILRDKQTTSIDPLTLALGALGWVLADGPRAERLLALTGLMPDDLRAGLADSAVLAAVLDFLAAHEPDLVAAADYLGVRPEAIIAAHRSLES
jgi:hypothetical protein